MITEGGQTWVGASSFVNTPGLSCSFDLYFVLVLKSLNLILAIVVMTDFDS